MIQYAIFDMDGTLIDSIPYWDELGLNYLKERGITGPRDLNSKMVSMSMAEAGVYMKETFSLSETPEEIMRELGRRIEGCYANQVELKPGAALLLEKMARAGIRMCVATASSKELGRPALLRNKVLGYFDFLVDCTQTGVGKTKPDIYYLAAERFGAVPEECVVIEDSSFALETAKKAGFHTVGVYEPSEKDPDKVRQYSDRYVRSLEELTEESNSI